MNIHPALEIPIRSKVQMVNDLVQILSFLCSGKRSLAEIYIDDLKLRSTFLDEDIQQAVLSFAESVYFQFVYDPDHKVTKEVEKAADSLIEKMGFNLSFCKTSPKRA